MCARTYQVSDAIVTASGAATCAHVALREIREITSLDLSYQGIASLSVGDFDGLVRLQTLDLSGNFLAALPQRVFDELLLLKTLRLDNNFLETLPANLFDELFLLEELTLDDNPLLALPDGMFSDFSRFAGMQPNGDPPDNTGDYPRINRFLDTHRVTSPEEFIAALPAQYKERFAMVYESEAAAADHVSGHYPRITSWGGDGRFTFAWNTDPRAPSEFRDVVEFLRQDDTAWTAGVIDFSGAAPTIIEPASCSTCHGLLNKPLWGAWNHWDGTEFAYPTDANYYAVAASNKAAAESTNPRIEPLDFSASVFLGDYDYRALTAPGYSDIEFVAATEEAGSVWAWRHAEVLYRRLKASEDDYWRFAETVMCAAKRSTLPARYKVTVDSFPLSDHNLAVLATPGNKVIMTDDTSHPVILPEFHFQSGGEMGGVVAFLIAVDLWQREPIVRKLFRDVSNADTVSPSQENTAELLLYFPSGSATAEDELIQKLRVHFGEGGPAAIGVRARWNGRPDYPSGYWSATFFDGLLEIMAPLMCDALTQTKPTNLEVDLSERDAFLSWDAPEDSSLTGYRILRGVDGETPTVYVDTAPADYTAWTDNGLVPGDYVWAVQALFDGYPSPESNRVSTTVPERGDSNALEVAGPTSFTVVEGETAVGTQTGGATVKLSAAVRTSAQATAQLALPGGEEIVLFEGELVIGSETVTLGVGVLDTRYGYSRAAGSSYGELTPAPPEFQLSGRTFTVEHLALQRGNLLFYLDLIAGLGAGELVLHVGENSYANWDPATQRQVFSPDGLEWDADDIGTEVDVRLVLHGFRADTDTLAGNSGQRAGAGAALGALERAQGFETGPHAAGYDLVGIDVDFLEAPASPESLRVSLWRADPADPARVGAEMLRLENPEALAPGINAFAVPGSVALAPGSVYFVVLSLEGSGAASLSAARGGGEDAGGLQGWAVADERLERGDSGGWSARQEPLRIRVRGLPQADPSWELLPPLLSAGNLFRLLVITPSTATTACTDTGIAGYDAFLQRVLGNPAQRVEALEGYGADFKALGSTATVDARYHTRTGYLPSYTGQPVYWIDGGKVADDYEDFYDGSWSDYDGRDTLGAAVAHPTGIFTGIFTGSNNDGTRHTEAPLGAGVCAMGRLAEGGVLTGRRSSAPQPLYGLSPLLQVAVRLPVLGAPEIRAARHVGREAEVNVAGIEGPGLPEQPSYAYQWIRVDAATGAETELAVGARYTFDAADLGHSVKVRASFTDRDGFDESLTSAAFGPILSAESDRPATGFVDIIGSKRVGRRSFLSVYAADPDGLPRSWSVEAYQWYRRAPGTGTDTPIEGATGNEYWPVAVDVGLLLVVEIGFHDSLGNWERLTSKGWGPVAAAGAPEWLRGLAAETGDGRLALTWDVPGEAGITGYQYQAGATREGSWSGAAWADVPGGGAATVRLEAGPLANDTRHWIAVRAVNAHGAGEVNVQAATPVSFLSLESEGGVTEVGEDGGAMRFTATFSSALDAPLTLVNRLEGDDIEPSDYELDASQTVPKGERTATILVRIANDSVDEEDETFTLSSFFPGSATLTAQGTIRDDDTEGVTLSVTELTVGEGGTRSYEVRLDSQPAGPVTVRPSSSNPAAAGVSGPLTFLPANWNAWQRIEVSGLRDADVEDATATIEHEVSGSGYATVPTVGSVVVTVQDSALGEPANLAAETGTGAALLRWQAPIGSGIVGYQYLIANASNAAWQDIPGSGATTAEHLLTGLENDREYLLRVRAVDGGGPGLQSDPATVTPVTVTVGDVSTSEGAGRLRFAAAFSSALTSPLRVGIEISAGDPAATVGEDYRVPPGIEVPAGSRGATIDVEVVDDAEDEADERFVLSLGILAEPGTDRPSATGTILNDDYVLALPGGEEIVLFEGELVIGSETVTLGVGVLDTRYGYSRAAGSSYGELTPAPPEFQLSGRTFTVEHLALQRGNLLFYLDLIAGLGAGELVLHVGEHSYANWDLATQRQVFSPDGLEWDADDIGTEVDVRLVLHGFRADTDTLAGNSGQRAGAGAALGALERAQGFETGPHAAGYDLVGIDVDFLEAPASPESLRVSLWRADPADPARVGAEMLRLENPEALAPGINAFAVPGSVALAPGFGLLRGPLSGGERRRQPVRRPRGRRGRGRPPGLGRRRRAARARRLRRVERAAGAAADPGPRLAPGGPLLGAAPATAVRRQPLPATGDHALHRDDRLHGHGHRRLRRVPATGLGQPRPTRRGPGGLRCRLQGARQHRHGRRPLPHPHRLPVRLQGQARLLDRRRQGRRRLRGLLRRQLERLRRPRHARRGGCAPDRDLHRDLHRLEQRRHAAHGGAAGGRRVRDGQAGRGRGADGPSLQRAAAAVRPVAAAPGGRSAPGAGCAGDPGRQARGAGGRGERGGDRGPRPAGAAVLRLPVDPGRCRDGRRDRARRRRALHVRRGRPGPQRQGAGQLHRPRRVRRVADQRGVRADPVGGERPARHGLRGHHRQQAGGPEVVPERLRRRPGRAPAVVERRGVPMVPARSGDRDGYADRGCDRERILAGGRGRGAAAGGGDRLSRQLGQLGAADQQGVGAGGRGGRAGVASRARRRDRRRQAGADVGRTGGGRHHRVPVPGGRHPGRQLVGSGLGGRSGRRRGHRAARSGAAGERHAALDRCAGGERARGGRGQRAGGDPGVVSVAGERGRRRGGRRGRRGDAVHGDLQLGPGRAADAGESPRGGRYRTERLCAGGVADGAEGGADGDDPRAYRQRQRGRGGRDVHALLVLSGQRHAHRAGHHPRRRHRLHRHRVDPESNQRHRERR